MYSGSLHKKIVVVGQFSVWPFYAKHPCDEWWWNFKDLLPWLSGSPSYILIALGNFQVYKIYECGYYYYYYYYYYYWASKWNSRWSEWDDSLCGNLFVDCHYYDHNHFLTCIPHLSLYTSPLEQMSTAYAGEICHLFC
jgi:hypothetical protein